MTILEHTTDPRKHRMPRKSRRGMIQMTETFIVKGIIATGVAAAALAGWNLYSTTKVQDTVQLVHELSQKTRDVFVNSSTYPHGSLMHTVITLGNLDHKAEGPSASRTLSTPFGGTITLTGARTSNFVLTFNDLPKEACSAVLNALIRDTQLVSSAVNTLSASTLPTTPLTETIIATLCSNRYDYDVALTFE